MAVPAIPVSLNQISGARAGACSDQRAFPATYDSAANSADTGADERAFESAVMRPAIIAPGAPLCIYSKTSESAE
jgi:hypothetical protein